MLQCVSVPRSALIHVSVYESVLPECVSAPFLSFTPLHADFNIDFMSARLRVRARVLYACVRACVRARSTLGISAQVADAEWRSGRKEVVWRKNKGRTRREVPTCCQFSSRDGMAEK